MSEWVNSLPWDTNFFGFKIGKIFPHRFEPSTLNSNLAQAQQAGYQCLYFEADPCDAATVSLAERYGFHLVDVRVVLNQTLGEQDDSLSHSPGSTAIRTGPFRPEDISFLEEIAVETGHLSRFLFDSRFPLDACPKLYRVWLNKALTDESCTAIVAYWNDRAAGLITCESVGGQGKIVLVGVHSHSRGLGLGAVLVQAGLDWLRSRGDSTVQVTTQARNVPAQRLYQKMGFLTQTVTLMYHKWL